MKTKSITSIAALVGATVALNLSALAGPGPQPQVQSQSVNVQKSVPAASSNKVNAPTIAFGGTKARPSLSSVTGPHGTVYLYRW